MLSSIDYVTKNWAGEGTNAISRTIIPARVRFKASAQPVGELSDRRKNPCQNRLDRNRIGTCTRV
jgi:hypothetical protein